ncbi:MAG: phage baseplate assembly protein [Alphaproteobacteria bacterium]|nr:phage baseplate assembly protein [Alphaproteobacteria bacterium]
MSELSALSRILRPVTNRIQLMVGRALLKLVDDSGQVQRQQIALLEGELHALIERMQNYGFAFHPHPGQECITLSLGGSRDHTIVICVNDRLYRLKGLAEGEVAVYDDLDQVVYLMRDRIKMFSPMNIEIRAENELRLSGKNVRVHADEVLDWDVHGYGPQRLTWTGGASFTTESWTTGAIVTGIPDHGFSPPEIERPWP